LVLLFLDVGVKPDKRA